MSKVIRNSFFYLATVYLVFHQSPVLALDWTLRPNVSFKEIYSDNIQLSDTNKQSAFVTEISPGVSINGRSSRGTVDINYNLQGLYNAHGDSGVDIHNQLQMDADYELLRKQLFVDSTASISQQNVSNRRIVGDNISGANDSSTISTFMISPYWTPHFKGFADGELRVTYDTVSSSGGNDNLSSTHAFSQSAYLNSGNDFSVFSWTLFFNNSDRQNSDSRNVRFQESQAILRYAVARDYSVFARIGHSKNSFASNSDSHENGVSYSFGGQWKPSQRFRIEAGYGNNRFVTVELSPFNRLHWITTYSNNDIGLNTGDRWDTELNYTTRRSVWRISYSEDTLTTQQSLLDQQVFNTSNGFGQQPTPTFNGRNNSLTSLTDEVFVTKTVDLSFSFRTGKSDIGADFFKTYRTFEQTGNEEEVMGISANWNWAFARRTHSSLRAGWQRTESDDINAFSDDRFDVSVAVIRNILSRLNGSLEYRYVDQSSDDNLNNYSENRVTANISLQF